MNLFVDLMNQSVLMHSDNTVLVELMVMFDDQLSTLRTEYSISYVCSVNRFHAVVHDSNSFN